MELVDFLRQITEAAGVSGFEGPVATLVRQAWEPLADEVRTDQMGSVIARRGARASGDRRLRVMFAAHLDEIGLLVTKIEEGGFLRFTFVGGFDRRVLPAQEVVVGGREPLPGVIGVKPPHLLSPEEAYKPYKPEDMYIDLGLPEEEVRRLVRVGDPVTVGAGCRPLQGDMMAGKALDDRAGVAVLFACLKELARLHHPHEVFLVATAQEEVGLKGAVTSAYGLAPDLGIAVDVEFAEQPGLPDDCTAALDKGPMLAVGPNVHPLVFSLLERVAREEGIPYQVRVVPGRSGTDAWAIQVAREGVPTGLVGIPLRYMHSSVEVVSLADIRRAGRLLARFVLALEPAALEGWRWEA